MSYGVSVVALAFADRFLLRRNKIEIKSVSHIEDQKVVRFALCFHVKHAIHSGLLTYSIRSKSNPSAVMTRTRKLDFSKDGSNSQFLTFDREKIALETGGDSQGDWVLNIKLERYCSKINPLYKIFPIHTHHEEDFNIE